MNSSIAFPYVLNRLAVLTVVHLDRDCTTRIISFPLRQRERIGEAYAGSSQKLTERE